MSKSKFTLLVCLAILTACAATKKTSQAAKTLYKGYCQHRTSVPSLEIFSDTTYVYDTGKPDDIRKGKCTISHDTIFIPWSADWTLKMVIQKDRISEFGDPGHNHQFVFK